MNCRQCQRALSRYLDGRLDTVEQARVAQHLADCQACATRHRLLQRAAAVLAVPGPSAPPAGLAQRAIQAALAADDAPAPAHQQPFLDRWLPIAWPTAIVASAVTVALLLLAFGSTAKTAENGDDDPVAQLAESEHYDSHNPGDDVAAVLALEP